MTSTYDVVPARVAFALIERGATLIDVREAGEHASEHVAGSHLVPLSELDARADSLPQGQLVLLCRSSQRARMAAQTLAKIGRVSLAVVDGGLNGWVAEGLPAERPVGASRAWAMERQVRFAAGSIVAVGTALAYFISPYLLVVPAFIGCGLVFSAVTDTCGMAMVLARMPWNRAKGVPSALHVTSAQ